MNISLQLDCLTKAGGEKSYYGGSAAFKSVMGLCFNNDIYYQLSKGFLTAELLEMLSNQSSLSPQTALVAPSMLIRRLWEEDKDFRQ